MEISSRHGRRLGPPFLVAALLAASLAFLGCERTTTSSEPAEKAADEPMEQEAAAEAEEGEQAEREVVRAVAQMKPTEGNDVSGIVYFEPTDDGVTVRATIMGLEPGSVHGFHIHEKGDCSAPDATSAGGHYAPEDKPHGLPPSGDRHAGDMGNITADEQGEAKIERTFDTFALEGDRSVVGRAVIVHAQKDKGTQPTGDAGARVACGVIAWEAEGVLETHTEASD